MTKITSTVYCDDPNCPGHITITEVPGQLVLTDNAESPFAIVGPLQSYEDYLSDEPNAYGIPDGLSAEAYADLVQRDQL